MNRIYRCYDAILKILRHFGVTLLDDLPRENFKRDCRLHQRPLHLHDPGGLLLGPLEGGFLSSLGLISLPTQFVLGVFSLSLRLNGGVTLTLHFTHQMVGADFDMFVQYPNACRLIDLERAI